MEGEQVSDLPSNPEGEDGEPSPFSYIDIFRKWFPYYKYLGMSYEEYWEMDCELVIDYRKAYEYKKEYDNFLAWWNGLYIYQAIGAMRPGFAFYGKPGGKPLDYLKEPFAVTEGERERRAVEQTKAMWEKIRATAHARNQKIAQQEEEGDHNAGTGIKDKDKRRQPRRSRQHRQSKNKPKPAEQGGGK